MGRVIGAITVWILEGDHHVLGTTFVDPDYQDCGVGTKIWQFVEASYPEAKTWRPAIPSWATKNHYFHEPRCGFQKVEWGPIPPMPED